MSIDWTKPIRVRETKAKAEVICTDLKRDDNPIVIRFFYSDGTEAVTTLTKEGFISRYSSKPFVENVPEMIEGYLDVYIDGYTSTIYKNIDRLDRDNKNTIARIKICHEVGRFDE